MNGYLFYLSELVSVATKGINKLIN